MQSMRLMYFTWKGVILDRSVDQARCSHVILGIESRIYRCAKIAMRFIPVGCTNRELMPLVFTEPATGFVAHGFGKKWVILIPLPRCRGQVKRGGANQLGNQIGQFEHRQHALACVWSGPRGTPA